MAFRDVLERLATEYQRQQREKLTGKTDAEREFEGLAPEMRRAQIGELRSRPELARFRAEIAQGRYEDQAKAAQDRIAIQQAVLELREKMGLSPKPVSAEDLALTVARTDQARAAAEADRAAARRPPGTGALKPTLDRETGEMVFASAGDIAADPKRYVPPPTADIRNQQYQAQSVEPAFDLVERSLDTLEQATGSLAGKAAGLVPGTQARFAKDRFVDQARALLGAIVARQSGEGSRLSDEDRAAYSQAATIVNNTILLPGGVQEARSRLADARKLLSDIAARRAQSVGGPADFSDVRGGSSSTASNLSPRVAERLKRRGY